MQLGVENEVSEFGTVSHRWNKKGIPGHILSAHPGRGRYKGVYMKDQPRNSLEENSA